MRDEGLPEKENDKKYIVIIIALKYNNYIWRVVIWMCTEAQLNRIMSSMVDCYRVVYGDDIVEIVLFGSYARGDYTKDSDIDIVALVRGQRTELQEKLKLVWDVSAELGLENDVVVSPTVIPYDEYVKYRETLPYYHNISAEGKKIG